MGQLKEQQEAASAEAAKLNEELNKVRGEKQALEAKVAELEAQIPPLPSVPSSPSPSTGSTRPASPKTPRYRPTREDPVDRGVAAIVSDLELSPDQVQRVGDGKYKFFKVDKIVSIRCVGQRVVVRIGGGWQDLKDYLAQHQKVNPIQKTI